MHSLNEAQLETLRAAANGELYRTTLGNYRISGHRSYRPSAYGLELVGLIEKSGGMAMFNSPEAHLVEGETIRATTAGLEVLASLTVHTTRAA